LEWWWTSFGLLLVSAVFLVRRGSEESGAKLVVREQQKNDCSRAGRRGEGRDEFSLHKAREKDRFGLDRPIWFSKSGLRTKPMGWVLQGRL
jgi:hypothetical protein